MTKEKLETFLKELVRGNPKKARRKLDLLPIGLEVLLTRKFDEEDFAKVAQAMGFEIDYQLKRSR